MRNSVIAAALCFAPTLAATAQEADMKFDTNMEVLLEEYDLPASSIETFRSVSKPAIAMVETGVAPTKTGSRLGGSPIVPANFEWPRDESGIKLTFIGQINLSDIPAEIAPLPDTGLIAIFKAGGESDRAYDRVFYFADVDALQQSIVAPDADDTTADAFSLVTWNSESKKLVPVSDQTGELKVIAGEDGSLRAYRDGIEVGFYADEYNVQPGAVALQPRPFVDLPEFEDAKAAYAKIGLTDDSYFTPHLYLVASVENGSVLQENHVVGGFPHYWGDPLPRPIDLAVDRAKAEGWADLQGRDQWFSLIVIQSSRGALFQFGDAGSFIVLANRADAPKGNFTRIVTVEDN